jgi:hypothetical protein
MSKADLVVVLSIALGLLAAEYIDRAVGLPRLL